MDVFRTDRIRNVVLLGHGGAGKTSLVEAMAYLSGITSRLGKVTDGNTVSDYDKEEIKRKFSISTSVVPIVWGKVKINVLDTPGYFDFVGEVEEAVSAADAAIIVVSGKDGIQVGTQKAWELCEKYKLPRMFFVTEMDIDDVSYRQVVEDLTEMYGKKIAPIHMPIREDGKFVGYVNIVKQAGRKYIDRGKKKECPVPDYLKDYLEKYHEILMESVAELSEEFMDRYFAGEEFSVAEVSAALKMNISDGSIIPVCMGSTINIQGVANLLDDICGYFPSPDQRSCKGINTKTNEIYQADYDFTKAKSAYVFKTIVDPFLGKYSLVKVCSGVIKGDDVLYNTSKEAEEKLNKLYVLEGSKPIEVPELHAGDIGAIAKLATVATGDTLSTKNTPILYGKTEISTPYTYKRYKTVNKGDEDKVSQALNRMMQEDLTLKVVNDSQNRQTLLYGIGEQHLDIVVSKLKERYKVDIVLSEPKVPFKETIRKKADVEAKYKKQSGGHGQYGHVKIDIEYDPDNEFSFEEKIFGGAVPKQYIPAVEKGMREAMAEGVLAGFPATNIKITLVDGSYHDVDSSEMAFKIAANLAFKKGCEQAKPILLEPIMDVDILVPDQFMGDIMGDMNTKRGRIMGMEQQGKRQLIHAQAPLAEMYRYAIDLKSITQGRGKFTMKFAKYEEVPANIAEKVIAAAKAEKENE